MKNETILRFKNIFSLSFLLVLILPICALKLSVATANYNLGAWAFGLFIFVLMPLVDHILGQDTTHPTADPLQSHTRDIYYTSLIYLSVGAAIVLSMYGAYFFSVTRHMNWSGRVGWIVTLGLCVAALALCPGHELIHRSTRIENLTGGIILAFVCNGFFYIEHIRGHHINVATPEDIATAKFNQSFYSFLPQALQKSFANAWSLEMNRLNRKEISVLSRHNRMICWHFVSLGVAISFYFLFGFLGLVFFLTQGLIALIAHQLINYIQHYGLLRRKQDDGRYESFGFAHAWNSGCFFSGMLSFQLQRHVDHHLNPRRRYHHLQHINESPQMPMGYFGMFIMALIPPLWFKVMNPRVLAYREGNASHLEASNLNKKTLAMFPHRFLIQQAKQKLKSR